MASKTSGADLVETAMLLALGAGAVYVAVKYVLPFFSSLGTGASAAANAVGQAGANAWLSLTNPSVLAPASTTVQLAGSVLFPNGAQVPLANIQNQSGIYSATDSSGNFYFTYGGNTVYMLGAGSTPGTYTAQPTSYATLAQAGNQ